MGKKRASLLSDNHPLTNDWSGVNMAFDLLEDFLKDRHKVLAAYPGFQSSFPQWEEEMRKASEMRKRIQKLVWDNAHKKLEEQEPT